MDGRRNPDWMDVLVFLLWPTWLSGFFFVFFRGPVFGSYWSLGHEIVEISKQVSIRNTLFMDKIQPPDGQLVGILCQFIQ